MSAKDTKDNALSKNSRRRYSGKEFEDRSRQRRQSLLDAALEVVGTTGYGSARVRDLCAQAGLSERYFYESFANREELMIALFNQLIDQIRLRSAEVRQEPMVDRLAAARTQLKAYISFMLDDPRNARVIFIESVGISTHVEANRTAALKGMAYGLGRSLLLPRDLGERASSEKRQAAAETMAKLVSVYMVGGLQQMIVHALIEDVACTQDCLVEVAMSMFEKAVESVNATLVDPS